MSKSKIITLQKTIYLCGQSREEGGCAYTNSNVKMSVSNVVMSDKKMEVEYNFNKKPWEYYPNYVNPEAKTEDFMSIGWNGLLKIMPHIDRDKNVECLVTIQFDEKDVVTWDSLYEIHKYDADEIKELQMYNFHCESDFYAVNKDNGDIMMCKGSNSLDWEIDDGYIKWDCDRENGTVLSWEDSPIHDLFPSSANDGHGVGVPYKMRIIVDAIV